MQETTEASMFVLPENGSLTDALHAHADSTPDRITIVRRDGEQWIDVSASEFLRQVRDVAKGLMASGLNVGDRVAIMSRTRFDWTITDYASWYAGCITVPIYETSSREQVEWILQDAGVKAVLVENDRHLHIVEQTNALALEHRWVFDRGALAELAHAGAWISDADLDARRSLVDWDDPATLIYTSGTTGRPKGCVLTHRNFKALTNEVIAAVPEVFTNRQTSTLLFLPLAHVFGRAIQVLMVESGLKLAHAPDATALVADLSHFRPNFLLAVPRVFEKIYNGAQQKAAAAGKGKIFDTAAATCIAYSRALDTAAGPGLGLRLRYALFDRLVYSKIRTTLGGNLEWVVSGGAPLGERLGHFFRGLGLKVLEGYGLTETTAPLAVGRAVRRRIGSVGPAIPGTTLRIAEDGEILAKGPQVFSGYWNNPAATAEVIDVDGWFHTGDIGRIDENGYLYITGRKKEMIVTANGKNVAPAPLEDRIRAHALVSQCMVVGDARPFVSALITLDPDALGSWALAHGLPADVSAAQLSTNTALLAELQSVVDDANTMVSKAESIRKFRVRATDWTEAGGQLTPSMKLKRSLVMQECADEIEALYA